MQHGVWLLNDGSLEPADAVEYAVTAEEAGWDGVFVSDSFSERGYTDPLSLLAGMAARTERIRLGTWVTPLARRQPWQVAQTVATLDRLSEGRVILGAGLGLEDDFEKFGLPTAARTRAAMLDEALEVIDGLWQGGPFSYDGDHYTVRDVELAVTPVQRPRVPVLLAGYWPNEAPFRRGARWDGMMPAHDPYSEQISEDALRAMLRFYHEQADEPGDVLIAGDLPETPPDFEELCTEVGVTWLLTTFLGSGEYELDEETIRAGPPE